jgi:phosphatidylglycerophosphate synthase
MSKRVSHSLLDPWLTAPLKSLYRLLGLSPQIRPEAIVATGHLFAIGGAAGFAWSTTTAWGGLLAAAGVAANHTADVLDGTHARATGQCRNGGELLDHFVDPLSFSYWTAGLAYSVHTHWGPWLGMAGVVVIYAMAVLTNIRAKMIGEFTLARFGPTEFKTLLILYGLSQAWLAWSGSATGVAITSDAPGGTASRWAGWFLGILVAAGVAQLKLSLWRAVRDVNEHGATPIDTTEWEHA